MIRFFHAVAASCLVMTTAVLAANPLPSAEALMLRSDAAPRVADSEGRAVMTLTRTNGQVQKRELLSWTRQSADGGPASRLTRFDAPAEVRGMATLLVENPGADDDVWIYLPALKRPRRVLADQKRDSFMGSDLSYGDVVGYRVNEWIHTLGDSSIQDDRPCRLVDSVPRTPTVQKSSGYSRRESCIDNQSGLATRVLTWDANGRALKSIVSGNLAQVDAKAGRWRARRVEARNLQTGTITVIEIDERVNVGLGDECFTTSALEREE
jgi:uncharacterized protein